MCHEFDYNGKLDSNKWSYEVRNQWYNEELQVTTDRLENVMELKGLAIQLKETEEITSMTEYLDRIALVSDIDGLDTNENSITLITLHQSKGLEFPVVFISGLDDGLFPLYQSIEDNMFGKNLKYIISFLLYHLLSGLMLPRQ